MRAQRRGQVVQLRVGDRGSRGVVRLERVDQAAGEAAGERSGEPGGSGLCHGVAVRCGRARFRAAEERGTDPGRGGACRENSRQSRAGGDPAGGDQRKADPCADQAEQGEDPVVLVTVGVAGER